METVTDKLETMILMSLDANKPETLSRFGKPGLTDGLVDTAPRMQIDDMRPRSAYTFDMTDDQRLIAANPNLLINHPSEIIGQESELIYVHEDCLQWWGFRQIKKLPRSGACIGKASHFYEIHLRTVTADGNNLYGKRLIALTASGLSLPITFQGHRFGDYKRDGRLLVSTASAIEDAHRTNTMLAAVKDATEIKFPVPLGDYKNVFSDRDGPMSGGRRKAIVHWVAKHLRHSTRGNEHEVKQHTRGVQEFTIDGLRIRLSPNLNSTTP